MGGVILSVTNQYIGLRVMFIVIIIIWLYYCYYLLGSNPTRNNGLWIYKKRKKIKGILGNKIVSLCVCGVNVIMCAAGSSFYFPVEICEVE